MTDRLAELRRQRLLISEHLAWLDREIAQIEGTAAQSPLVSQTPAKAAISSSPETEGPAETPPPVRPEGTPQGPEPAAAAATGVDAPEILLEEFRAPPGAVNRDVRQGCLLYFAAAFVLLGIGVAILYFTIGSR